MTASRPSSKAGATARKSGTVDDGLDVLRPVLREALVDALVQGGVVRADAEAAVSDGSWTDDDVAASVEETISGPDRSFRKRVYAWLFPERVVRRLARRSMGAVADAADEALPTVPARPRPDRSRCPAASRVDARCRRATRTGRGSGRGRSRAAAAGDGPVDADSNPNDVDSISSKTDSSPDETDANAGAVDGVRAARRSPTESETGR
ncbi:hypothetical protein D8S78_05320 [Natrialba swarupiae]|nr:hypothetical protein [Natrialba swarupiae]